MKTKPKMPVVPTGAGIGKPIMNAKRVVEISDKGKAIYHVRWGRPVAATWLANMPLRLIVGFIRMHWLYEYRAKSPRRGVKGR